MPPCCFGLLHSLAIFALFIAILLAKHLQSLFPFYITNKKKCDILDFLSKISKYHVYAEADCKNCVSGSSLGVMSYSALPPVRS